MQTIEIRSAKVTFDKEKTKSYRTAFNQPCDRPTVAIFRRKDRNLRSFSIDKYRPL